ncbi:zinc-ribbon domain-containing protein [Cohnella yongneupensis]|uniref:Zinc-ribbon domain-containing protein n=1 Tax=Cohnella yongneupensis TaxID=425006 RepID=A0ABW0QVI7_9BACL
MFCNHCGNQHEANAKFCTKCGASIAQQPQAATPAQYQQPAQPYGQQPLVQQQPYGQQQGQPFYQPNQPRQMSKQTMGLIAAGLVIIVGGLIFYFSGSGGSQSSPKSTVESFMEAVKAKDGKALVKLISDDSLGNPDKDELNDIIDEMEDNFGSGSLKSYKILDTDIDDDTATVDYEVTYSEDGEKQTEEDSFDLVKVEGKWYIDEDMGF